MPQPRCSHPRPACAVLGLVLVGSGRLYKKTATRTVSAGLKPRRMWSRAACSEQGGTSWVTLMTESMSACWSAVLVGERLQLGEGLLELWVICSGPLGAIGLDVPRRTATTSGCLSRTATEGSPSVTTLASLTALATQVGGLEPEPASISGTTGHFR
jgi:hypothetical protein